MAVMSVVRALARALPFKPATLQRARRLAATGFRAAAWLRLGRRRGRPALRPGPIVVVGFHSAVVGIGEGARAFSATLRRAGLEVIDWDISSVFGHPVLLEGDYVTAPPADGAVLVLHLNPPEVVQLVAMLGAAPFEGRYCIGYWAWELPSIPRAWRAALRYVDEVWAPSRFVAEAVRQGAPSALPVRVFPHPLEPRPDVRPDRARFDLPSEGVVVLTAFDMRSSLARKNPYGAIAAFRGAADRAGVPAVMICKVAGRESAPHVADAMAAFVAGDDRVRFLGGWLTDADMACLIASCDVVLSLHRSEGFGLLLAQGMLAGKAVVATGWSGNLDFMTPETSVLVPSRLVPVDDEQGIYIDGRWAEADVDAATVALAGLMADAKARRALGKRAARDVAARLAPEHWAAQAKAWLAPDQTLSGSNGSSPIV